MNQTDAEIGAMVRAALERHYQGEAARLLRVLSVEPYGVLGPGLLVVKHSCQSAQQGEPTERRALVQPSVSRHPSERRKRIAAGELGLVPGTISWAEYELAWKEYVRRYGGGQSAERIRERIGFSYAELTDLLGRPPQTWKPVG